MKQYNSHYLGICINNDDPQKRGRVQVFVPQIMPALYEDWNKEGQDLAISCVGDNISAGLPDSVIKRLKTILPWAECAAPIMAMSGPGGGTVPNLGGVSNFFDTSPVSNPGEAADVSSFSSQVSIPKSNSSANTNQLHPVFAQRLNGFYQEAKQLGYNITLTSAYRSIEHQARLFQQMGGRGVAKPGSSAHNYGIAVDIKTNGPGVSINQISIARDRTQNKDTAQYRSLLAKYKLHQPLHPDLYRTSAPEKWHIEPIETAPAGGPRGANHFKDVVASLTSGGPSPIRTSVAGSALPNTMPGPEGPPSLTNFDSPLYGTNADPTTDQSSLSLTSVPNTSLTVGSNGRVDPNQLRTHIEGQIKNSSLNGFVPKDGAKYGVDGSAKSWANFLTGLSEKESGWKATTTFKESFTNNGKPVISTGLFQVSTGSLPGYGFKNVTQQQLNDPVFNTNAAIKIFEQNTLKSGYLADPSTGKGAWNGRGASGSYFAKASMSKVAADAASGKLGTFNPNTASSVPEPPTALINNPDRHGTAYSMDVNNMAQGMFAYPGAGAMLWVFFREGNPLYPVYFAASYSQSEWSSAYRTGSEVDGYAPSQGSTGLRWNTGAGGIAATNSNSYDDRSKDQKNFTIFGYDGSNLSFEEGCTQMLTKYDLKDQCQKDRFETTLGARETWVQQDDSLTCFGDVIIKIGNVSRPAKDAVNRIQEILNEIQAPLLEEA